MIIVYWGGAPPWARPDVCLF